jgi:hypothetical protein
MSTPNFDKISVTYAPTDATIEEIVEQIFTGIITDMESAGVDQIMFAGYTDLILESFPLLSVRLNEAGYTVLSMREEEFSVLYINRVN